MSRHWGFTLNNWTPEEFDRIVELHTSGQAEYLVVGREIAPTTGTPHLQGYIAFVNRKAQNTVRNLLPRAHVYIIRGTPAEASTYCRKDGDFSEFGTVPVSQGHRSDIDAFIDWLKNHTGRPSIREVALAFPRIVRSSNLANLQVLIEAHTTAPAIRSLEDPRRAWQQDLIDYVSGEPDDRTVRFYVDTEGNVGKTWICQWLVSNRDDVQVLSVGRREDLSYAVDETKRVYLFDIPRQQMQFLRYEVLEGIKNQMLFSTKYASRVKVLQGKAHVVVFSNEHPDYNAMSEDRYDVKVDYAV